MNWPFDFSQEYFHGDHFSEAADVRIGDDGKMVGDLSAGDQVVFCKTDYLPAMFRAIRAQPHKYVLITHNSDHPIDARRYFGCPAQITRWYALNVAWPGPKLVPLPMGMERPAGQGYSSNPQPMIEALAGPRTRQNLVYVNHSLTTRPETRVPAWEWFADKSWATKEQKVPIGHFYRQLRAHPFHACPEGNGVDCMRVWQALWLGCIPIVIGNWHWQGFKDLPVLQVSAWESVTEDRLVKTQAEFESRSESWAWQKLTRSYWLRAFRAGTSTSDIPVP